jgi:beta-mannanase
MVWAPNTGVGYPFRGAGKYFPSADSEQYKQMDTNEDGALDANDDPFAPYYPGDDVVDWVGISLYSKVRNPFPAGAQKMNEIGNMKKRRSEDDGKANGCEKIEG